MSGNKQRKDEKAAEAKAAKELAIRHALLQLSTFIPPNEIKQLIESKVGRVVHSARNNADKHWTVI